jgi:nitric oxide reductase subunit B
MISINPAAQPLSADDPGLSPWWLRSLLVVMALGFSGLIAITTLAYRNAPPIPAQVVDTQGAGLFTGEAIGQGQAVFLKYGLMNNGSIWGHGAYLGPDYSAEALHRFGTVSTACHRATTIRKAAGRVDGGTTGIRPCPSGGGAENQPL